MRLSQIHTLLAVADAGSIRAAARKLGRSQPALTKSLQQLEEELRVPVFRRTTRGVVLTGAGEAAARRARSIVLEVERLIDEVDQAAGQRSGSVRVVASPVAATRILPAALRDFRRRWSSAQVVITAAVYPEAFRILREGHADFVVGPIPAVMSSTALEAEPLFESRYAVLCSKTNPRRTIRTLEALQDAEWVCFGPADGPTSLLAETFNARGLDMPAAMTRSDSLAAALAITEATNAFCVLTDQLLSYALERHHIRKVNIQEALPRNTHALVTRSSSHLTPAAEALTGAIRRQARSIDRGKR